MSQPRTTSPFPSRQVKPFNLSRTARNLSPFGRYLTVNKLEMLAVAPSPTIISEYLTPSWIMAALCCHWSRVKLRSALSRQFGPHGKRACSLWRECDCLAWVRSLAPWNCCHWRHFGPDFVSSAVATYSPFAEFSRATVSLPANAHWCFVCSRRGRRRTPKKS